MNRACLSLLALLFGSACTTGPIPLPPEQPIDPPGPGVIEIPEERPRPEPNDLPDHSAVHVAGDFNGWVPGAPGYALSYQGGDIWAGAVMLPAGRHALKFTADGSWDENWGGGQDDLLPPEAGLGEQAGPDIILELPLSGLYELSLNEESGAWSISFAPGFEQGLPAVGSDFLALLEDIEAAPELAASLEEAFVSAHAGSELPVVRGGDVLFLTLGDLRPGLSVAGSFNSWTPGQDLFMPLGGGLVGYVGRQVGGNARHAYKFTDGAAWFRDPQAFEIEWDGFNPNTVGEFNSVFFTQGAVPSGRLRLLRAQSSALSNEREVYVFLPPGYDENPQERYPTLYFHDGNESIVRSQMDQVVRDEILAGRVAPLIAVFVALPSQEVRFAEYTFGTPGSLGDSYKSFIADELVPLIDQRFRTLASPEARGIIGASLGGLISFHIGYERDDVFRRVGGQSSSFFWNNAEIIDRLAAGPKKELRLYLDAGNVDGSCGGGDNCGVTRQMKGVLDSRGYSALHVEQLFATHDWSFWKERLPGALRFLFPPSEF